MGMTIVEKILAKATKTDIVKPGDVIEPEVNVAMSHENAALVINQFNEVYKDTGLEQKVWDPNRIAIIFDHRVPAESSKTATNQKKIRNFVKANGIAKFHDIRSDEGGICHQILAEYGYIKPGDVVVGTDSHTTTHGAFGAFAFGIGATEMASVWSLGTVLNVEVPDTIKIVVNGKLKENVYPKDLILYIIGKISAQGANYKVIEFHGDAIKNMSMSGRLVLSNMAVEAGATAGIIPGDSETERYLREAGVTDKITPVLPDSDAKYCQVVEINANEFEPQIACPHTVDNVKPISEVKGIKVDQIVIGSCTNGRIDDLEIAASILKGKKVAEDTRMLIFPASWKIYKQALKQGLLEIFSDSGAIIMNPGCGCCLGVHQGAIGDGEVALSTTNRNFKGRMGNPRGDVYLCSPAVAAASAVAGEITSPIMKGVN
ncbi:MAG: 3-isopropylmalate dehydratase large subunit [Candidatus Kapaibacterium sp.]